MLQALRRHAQGIGDVGDLSHQLGRGVLVLVLGIEWLLVLVLAFVVVEVLLIVTIGVVLVYLQLAVFGIITRQEEVREILHVRDLRLQEVARPLRR